MDAKAGARVSVCVEAGLGSGDGTGADTTVCVDDGVNIGVEACTSEDAEAKGVPGVDDGAITGTGVCDGARIGAGPGDGARTGRGARGAAGAARIAVCVAAIGAREEAKV